VRIVVLAQGKLKERALRELVDDYLGRVRRYARCDEIEVKDAGDLARAVPKDAVLVALEVDGERLSSVEFSARLSHWGARAKGIVAFVIGGAEGLPPALSAEAAARLSLSSFTLPHRLARLMLAEQIYRAFTLLRGEPYARE